MTYPSRFVAVALAAFVAIAPSCAQPAGRQSHPLGDSDRFASGLGVALHISSTFRHDIQQIAEAGFHVVRTDLLWAHVEKVRGIYDWRASDAVVKQLRQNQLTPLLILDYSNQLYAPRIGGNPQADSLAYAAPQDGQARAAFMAFVNAAAQRYRDQVMWEIWNEPDHNFGSPVDLRGYIGFAQQACATIRQVDPQATVLGPAASGFIWWFLQDFVNANNRSGCFDALSVHPYRDWEPESVLSDWARAWSLLPVCGAGTRCLTLADTEWGYSVTGGTWTADRQAAFVVRIRLLDMIAGVPLTVLYDWKNDASIPAEKEANFGLRDYNDGDKAAFVALLGMTRALNGLRYLGRARIGKDDEYLLAFGSGDDVKKLVVWSASDRNHDLILSRSVCFEPPHGAVTYDDGSSCGGHGFTVPLEGRIALSEQPVVFITKHIGSIWRVSSTASIGQ
jgi:hypothetical protein